MIKKTTNWNNYPIIESTVYSMQNENFLRSLLSKNEYFIPRGKGRSYGDASLSKNIISNLDFNNFLEFNETEGIIHCQSGVTLDEILKIVIPKGWFLPVTPGTKYVSMGGAIASDVHGKNHHIAGSFSNHLIDLRILCGDGNIYSCSKESNPDLFAATCGGMGLTGIILSARLKLKKIETSFIAQKQIKARNLEEIFNLFEQYNSYPYSVAWIDCLQKKEKIGRSILMVGDHAKEDQIRSKNKKLETHGNPGLNIPFFLPSILVNSLTVKSFNYLLYHKNTRPEINNIAFYNSFFYPLDVIDHQNRMYGREGFLQYQFVLPFENSFQGLQKILTEISKQGNSSFLAVLKLFGYQDSLISFPFRGYTLALDFPITGQIFKFFDRLDSLVQEYGGRLYLAKDARMDHKIFKQGYPGLNQFRDIVKKYNPGLNFRSNLSNRLKIFDE